MSGRRSWMSVRLSLRLGSRRFLLIIPPAVTGYHWQLLLAASILLPVGYVVSAVPTIKVLRKTGLYTPTVESCAMIFYAPLVVLERESALCREFFQAEERLLTSVFGE